MPAAGGVLGAGGMEVRAGLVLATGAVRRVGRAGSARSGAGAAVGAAQLPGASRTSAILFESIRPEIRQYFLEDDNEETPFSRVQRSIIYQRAKNALDKRPFGTQLDVYAAAVRVDKPLDAAARDRVA
jgi:hypothetical protein